MTQLLTTLASAGVDVDGALYRFMNREELYEKFLLHFVQDDTFSKLIAALDIGDATAVETQAHTLKGVVANLGMNTLSEICGRLVRHSREGALEQAIELRAELEAAYQKVVSCLRH